MAASSEIDPELLLLSHAPLDRDALTRSRPGLLESLLADPHTGVLAMEGERLPVSEGVNGPRLALRSPTSGDEPATACYLGRLDGQAIVAIFSGALQEPDPGHTDPRLLAQQARAAHRSLRSVAAALPAAQVGMAVPAVAMANWVAAQRFCSRCGQPTELADAGWVARCANGHDSYPRTDGAVIMAIVDADDRLLLAHGARHPGPMVSVLAGFVEPGESFEAAVAREAGEEVGVQVTDVRYAGNQPWPMPASLMIGFYAKATTTQITVDPVEIGDARWFTHAELVGALERGEIAIPPRLSIARHLIEGWHGGALPDGASLTR